jgi:hypothetical protein
VEAVEFRRITDTEPRPFASSWEQLADRLSVHRVTTDKRTGRLWSPTTYRPGSRRSIAGVEQINAFVLDLDDTPLDTVRPKLDGLSWLAYSTYSYNGVTGCHLAVELADPVSVWEWETAWDALFVYFGEVGDRACRDCSRAFYQPQHPPGAPSFVERHDGRPLDAHSVPALRPRPRPERKTTTPRRTRNVWQDESWWNEPQDLSRFEGKTQQEIAGMLLDEFQELRRANGF